MKVAWLYRCVKETRDLSFNYDLRFKISDIHIKIDSKTNMGRKSKKKGDVSGGGGGGGGRGGGGGGERGGGERGGGGRGEGDERRGGRVGGDGRRDGGGNGRTEREIRGPVDDREPADNREREEVCDLGKLVINGLQNISGTEYSHQQQSTDTVSEQYKKAAAKILIGNS